MKKRKGFALALVLVLMIFIIGISAVIMDMTTNYVSSSQSTIEHQKLYNAAQSGIEWGKAWLLDNSSDLDFTQLSDVDELSDLEATLQDGSSYPVYSYADSAISVNIGLYYCNYVPASGVDPVAEDLPPVYEKYLATSSGSSNAGIGTSGFIDPNRNLLGLGDEGDEVFVIRSEATAQGKSTEIESMVVIAND